MQGDVTLKGDFRGQIADGKMTLTDPDGAAKTELKRIERRSPTLGAKPPAGATVLFDGTSADKFQNGELTQWKTLMSGPATKDKFNSYSCTSSSACPTCPRPAGRAAPTAASTRTTATRSRCSTPSAWKGENNECGGFYSIKAPDVNMCLPPLAWQTYDIDFTAPKYDASGKKVGQRADDLAAQRGGHSRQSRAAARHAGPPARRTGPAAALPAGTRQQGAIPQHLARGKVARRLAQRLG